MSVQSFYTCKKIYVKELELGQRQAENKNSEKFIEVKFQSIDGLIGNLVFSDNNKLLNVCGKDWSRKIDLQTGRSIEYAARQIRKIPADFQHVHVVKINYPRKGPLPLGIVTCTLSPDANRIARSDDAGYLHITDLKTNDTITCFGHGANLLTYSPDGKWLAACDKKEKSLRTRTDVPGIRFTDAAHKVCTAAFSPDSKRFAAASRDKIEIHDCTQKQPIQTLQEKGYSIRSLAFSRDGKFLAAAGAGWDDCQTSLWDISSGIRIDVISPGANAVAFSHNDRWLVSAGKDCIYLYDTVEKICKIIEDQSNFTHCFNTAVFSSNDSILALKSWDGICLIDMTSL